jgi:hypothetical protein
MTKKRSKIVLVPHGLAVRVRETVTYGMEVTVHRLSEDITRCLCGTRVGILLDSLGGGWLSGTRWQDAEADDVVTCKRCLRIEAKSSADMQQRTVAEHIGRAQAAASTLAESLGGNGLSGREITNARHRQLLGDLAVALDQAINALYAPTRCPQAGNRRARLVK